MFRFCKKFIILLFILCSFQQLSAQLAPNDAASLMQKGINLGNTLEPPFEGGWNNPAAQQYYFELYEQAGFNTIRIPVRWDEHTEDTGSFMVNENWMQRVEQVVDWALDRDLFVIINAHHEEWIKSDYQNAQYRARFDSIWSQIAIRFKDKPERLLFEVINEPYGLTKDQNNELHGRILSIIRKSNPTRIVIIQGHNWGGSDELIAMTVPDDNYLMGSFHSYDPYMFGLQGVGLWGSANDYTALRTKFETVNNWSIAHNIPIILGEFGSLRTCDYNSRMKHYRAYVEYSQQYGFVSCAWDDGGDFRIMNRAERTWDEVKDILISTNTNSPKSIDLKVVRDTMIRITWFNAVTTADSIFIEHRAPSEKYKRIASLNGDSAGYTHLKATDNVFHHYRIIAHFNSGQELYSQPVRIFLPEYVPKVRSSYLEQPLIIPGIVEAEYFDVGGEGLTYHDASEKNITGALRPAEAVDIYSAGDDSYIVGSIWPGEWLEYTVNIENNGLYQVDHYIAAYQAGGIFKIQVGERSSPDIVAPSSNSMTTAKIVSDTMELQAGEQIMRLTIVDDHPTFNIDKVVFSAVDIAAAINDPVHSQFPVSVLSTDERLKVSWRIGLDITRLDFYTVYGALVKTVNQPANNSDILLGDHQKGIYILKALTPDKSYSIKFMVQ